MIGLSEKPSAVAMRKWRAANHERYQDYLRKNIEQKRACGRRWRVSEKGREQGRRWEAANREKKHEYHRKSYIKNLAARMLKSARMRARKEGFNFNLSKEDIVIPTHCPVLGIEFQCGHLHASDNSPTLDRIDNGCGYVRGNVVVVSLRANRLKSSATITELRKIAEFYAAYENSREMNVRCNSCVAP